MKLFSRKGDELQSIANKDFKLEKEIQQLIENNLGEIFNLEFVRSEMPISNFRIDTLAFDKENNCFVVIEYKKDRNFSVIDQGYTYMSLLLNNKADFVLEYNEQKSKSLKKNDVEWSQSKVIFIAPSFSEYQKHSVNFKDVPFELWEIKQYENAVIGLMQHKNSSTESITNVTAGEKSVVKEVSKQIQVYTEAYHFSKSKKPNPEIEALYRQLKERILTLGEVEVVPKGLYISFRKKKPFFDVVVYQKEGLYCLINLKKGQLNDPNGITKDVSNKGHWGNGDYSVLVKSESDLDYIMFLIKQSYNAQS